MIGTNAIGAETTLGERARYSHNLSLMPGTTAGLYFVKSRCVRGASIATKVIALLLIGISGLLFIAVFRLPERLPQEQMPRTAQDPGNGQSLIRAVQVARFGLSREQHAPFNKESGAGYLATSHNQGLNAWFGENDVRVWPSVAQLDGARTWQLEFELKGYGRGQQLAAVPPIVSRHVNGTRIEYERAASSLSPAGANQPIVTEWYENRREGIEQGFTLHSPPGVENRHLSPEPLRLVLRLEGDLRAQAPVEGGAIELLDADGKRALTYDRLVARDAHGRQLDARMEVSADGREIALVMKDADAAYPIVVDPIFAATQTKIVASDGAAGDQFGARVAISGDIAVVGANRDDVDGKVDQGSAYVFVRNGANWDQQARLTASDGLAGDQFGSAVDISGNTVVVGARYADLYGYVGPGYANNNEGKAYVFTRSNASAPWVEQKLTAKPPTNSDNQLSAFFGWAVAISGNTIVIGSPGQNPLGQGAAYIFVFDGSSWVQQTYFRGEGYYYAYFGYSVGISLDTVVVGAPLSAGALDSGGQPIYSGAAYVFVGSEANWTFKAKLAAPDAADGDNFGYDVAIDGDTVIVGAPFDDIGSSRVDQGSIHIFARSGTSWSQQFAISGSDSLAGDTFGREVAISHGRAIVGSPGHDVNGRTDQGEAYVFTKNSAGLWAETERLMAVDGAAGDLFGTAISLTDRRAIIGAFASQSSTGAAYIFETPDSDGDGIPDDWELHGITVDSSGGITVGNTGNGVFIDLPKMGADPMHKDIFVHADWLQREVSKPDYDFQPSTLAMKEVSDAFAIAPVANPDGTTGINLHVDAGPGSIMNPVTGETWGVLSRAGKVPFQDPIDQVDVEPPFNWPTVDTYKGIKFNPAGRSSIFHYALYCKTYRETGGTKGATGGLSRGFAATDFLVALGNWRVYNQFIGEAGVFMHELGHNLGLRHGGGDDINYKPNYLSIMNYRFKLIATLRSNGTRSLDYSRRTLDTLDETRLEETVGINDPDQHLTTWNRFTRPLEPPGSNACIDHPDSFYKSFYPDKALDWDCDGNKTFLSVQVDLNSDGRCVGPGADGVLHATKAGDDMNIGPFIISGPNRTCETTAACDPKDPTKCDEQLQIPTYVEPRFLVGFNDWPVLVFDGGGAIGRTSSAISQQSNRAVALIAGSPSARESTYEEIAAEMPSGLLAEELIAPRDVVAPLTQTGATVTFDGGQSTAVNGNVVKWSWDFGDGTTGSGATATHTYAAPGTYFASLTVTDSNGHVNLVPLLERVIVGNGPPPTPTPTPLPSPTPAPSPTIPPGPTPIGSPGQLDESFNATATVYGGRTYNGNAINAVITQPDGKIIVGGAFESFAGCARRNLARINADGSCDPTFDPGLVLTDVLSANKTPDFRFRQDLQVKALALQPDGKIIVGVEGIRGWEAGVSKPSKGIVRLNADGTLDPFFNARGFVDSYIGDSGSPVLPNVSVRAIALQPDGRIVIGGSFTYTNGGRRFDIARLKADGSVDPSFTGGFGYLRPTQDFEHDGYLAFVLQPDGKIVAGGSFGSDALHPDYCGTPVLRINADGSLDPSFNANRRDPSAGTCASFYPGLSTTNALALQRDGRVILAGGLLSPDQKSSVPAVRLNPDGTRDVWASGIGFNGFSSPGVGVALQADGKVIVVGDFGFGEPATRIGVARLNPNFTLDAAYNASTGTLAPANSGQRNQTSVLAVALQANGKAVIGGIFDHFNGLLTEGIVQINPDGSRDQAFASSGPGINAEVFSLIKQLDGKMLVGFASGSGGSNGDSPRGKLNSTNLGGIGRLNPDGSTDTIFSSPFDNASTVSAIALQSDRRMVVGGNVRLIGDTSGNVISLTRLNSNGTLDATFHPPPDVRGTPVIQPDGKILVAGNSADGTPGLVRLNANGSRDDAFITAFFPNGVSPAALQPDGRILVLVTGHDFRPSQIARLNANGSVDATFNPGSGPDNSVRALVLQTDGKILIGGDFYNYNGTARNCLARLNSDGSLDASFVPDNPNSIETNPIVPAHVGALAVQPDGRVIAGGYYYSGSSLDQTPNRLFRLKADGRLDSSFPLGPGFEAPVPNINTILLQPDGQAVVGGAFNVVNGTAHVAIARLFGTPPATPQLANISTRLRVKTGENVLIGGFIITGSAPKKVMLRAIGPSLTASGVTEALADPTLELHKPDGSIVSNDNWRINDATGQSQELDIKATTIPPTNELESAIVQTLPPGAYTAIVAGKGGGASGIALVEAYDLAQAAPCKLGNISTRGFVDTGDNAMIGGFIVAPAGSANLPIVVRAIGPSLGQFGITNALQNPILELHDANGGSLTNDDWQSDANVDLIPMILRPADTRESCTYQTLPPGPYTAIVRGVDNTTGVALIEVYALD
jgi:uncharacterized delta-60 repeat protein